MLERSTKLISSERQAQSEGGDIASNRFASVCERTMADRHIVHENDACRADATPTLLCLQGCMMRK